MIMLPPDLVSRYTGKPDGGFALIANVETIDASVEVLPGLTLRRAEPHEAATLHEFLRHSPSTVWPMSDPNPYETRLIVEHVGENQQRFHWQPLDEHEFKYVVAAFIGSNAQAHHLVERSPLTSFELELGPAFISIAGGSGYIGGPDMDRTLQSLQRDETPFLRLDQQAVAALHDVYTRYDALGDSRIGLRATLDQYNQLKRIAPTSPLRFLGYVAIIESLITHKPDPKDPYDSLTRQVRQKMLLLSRRFCLKLNHDHYFPSATPKTVWTQLYAYRSDVAHGVKPDFTRTLKVLRGPTQALDFIRAATRSVMRHALDEPDLVADLREC